MNAAPAIYPHAVSPRRCIVLPSGVCACTGGKATRTSSPYDAGIHELSASDVHSPHVTMRLVSSCLTFSPLPPLPSGNPCPKGQGGAKAKRGRLFSSALIHPYGQLPVKKRIALRCPDFPPASPWNARGKPFCLFFMAAKLRQARQPTKEKPRFRRASAE